MRFYIQCGALLFLMAGACSNNPDAAYPNECRDDAGDDIKNAGEVAGQGIEGGVETGVAGVKQAGRAVGGLVTGGTDKADAEWEAGKAETKQEANEASAETSAVSKPNCSER